MYGHVHFNDSNTQAKQKLKFKNRSSLGNSTENHFNKACFYMPQFALYFQNNNTQKVCSYYQNNIVKLLSLMSYYQKQRVAISVSKKAHGSTIHRRGWCATLVHRRGLAVFVTVRMFLETRQFQDRSSG